MEKDLWRRLEPILDTALDLPPAERPAFLDQELADDPSARAEIDAFLAECSEVDDFLDLASPELAATRLASLDSTSPETAPEPHIGRLLGNYRLVKVLGRGGMGTVFLGRRADGLFEQEVAIKVADRLRLGPGGLERFHYERRILAGLDHPNVARLFDGGLTPDGLPYLVMELVNGAPLDQHCRRGGLGLHDRVRLLIEACTAIDHAHQRRVIHLDLKPSNILVTEEGTVKLLDFGVAELLSTEPNVPGAVASQRRTEGQIASSDLENGESARPVSASAAESESDTPGYSLSGFARLTPSFASPERLSDKPLTYTSDIYSMGVVAYLLAEDRLPFVRREGEDPLDFARRTAKEIPPPPTVDADLRAVLGRAMAKGPNARYRSAAELAEDLQRYLDQRPVSARPATPGYLARRALARHRWTALAALGVGLVVAFLALGWWHGARQAEERIRVARLFASEAEKIEGFLRYAYALPSHDVRRETALSEARIEKIGEQIHSLGSLAAGSGHLAMGRGYLGLRRPDEAREHLEAAWALGEHSSEAAFTLGRALGEIYGRERQRALRQRDPRLRELRLQELERRFRNRAVDLLGQARGASRETVSTDGLAGLIALYDGHPEEAIEHGKKAALATPWLPDGPRLEGNAHSSMGEEAMAEGEYTRAEKAFTQALEALSRAALLSPSDPSLAEELCAVHVTRAGLAGLRKTDFAGPFGAGLETCELALSLHPDRDGPKLELASLYLASVQDPRLDLDEREMRVGSALELLQDLEAEEAEALRLLGSAHLSMAVYIDRARGRDPRPALDAAAEAFREAVEVDPYLLAARVNLGTSLAIAAEEAVARGDDPLIFFEAAIISFHQALDQAPRHGLLLHNLSTLLYRVGQFRWGLGENPLADFSAAEEQNERTLAEVPELPAALNLKGAIQEALGVLSWRLGKPVPTDYFARAEEALEAALEVAPTYHLAWVNKASLLVARARILAAGNGDTDALVRTALSHLDHAQSLVRVDDPTIFANRAEAHLFSARRRLEVGDSPRAHLQAARRSLEAGLAIDAQNPLLGLYLGELLVLEARARPGGPICPAEGLQAIRQLLSLQRSNAAARALAAEAHMDCADTDHTPKPEEGSFPGHRHLDEASRLLRPIPDGPGAPPRLEALQLRLFRAIGPLPM